MSEYINTHDIIIVPLYLILVYFWASQIQKKHIAENPYYKYFKAGLMVNVVAGLVFSVIYLFYYDGGDTI